jgi:hypothetical protein
MLTIEGNLVRHCDGISRREALRIGSLGAAGLTLTHLLRAEAAAGIRSSRKAIINVHLDGGPPQLDTIDLKPQAPVEIRGEFSPIATSLPGVQICELLPRVAAAAHKFAFIRSLTGSAGAHNAFQCQSGFDEKDLKSLGGRPALGCVAGKLQGRPEDVAPPFVDLMQGRALVRNSARPGFLGPAYQPFRPDISAMFPRALEPGMQNELARLGENQTTSLTLDDSLSLGRLDDRRALLSALDRVEREFDASGMMDAMDHFTRQAASILTSGRLAAALDLEREDLDVLARYSMPDDGRPLEHYTAEGPVAVRKFLLARRLIEAGVRVVTLSISDFDTHSNNFGRMRQLLPIVDHGLSALVADLEQRGLLDDVLIVAWGEFGRTPRIDPNSAGRHHWPQAGPALLAGGGLRVGQVSGATDREAGVVIDRPVTYKDIVATLYRHLGIDAHRTTVTDPQGRPQHLLDEGEALRELV